MIQVFLAHLDKVLFTPFKTVNVPPPMSFCESTHLNTVTSVAFSNQKNRMLVLHHNQLDFMDTISSDPKILGSLLLPMADPRSVLWISDCIVLCLSYNTESDFDQIHQVVFKPFDIISCKILIETKEKIISLKMSGSNVFYQTEMGAIFKCKNL